jgi:DNA-binding LacI/PurR family transcriptional regulator
VLEPDQLPTYQPLVRRDGRDLVNHLVCAGAPAAALARLPRDGHALRVLTGLRRNRAEGFDYAVMADHGEALLQAVGRLAALGHRRIALLMSPWVEAEAPIPALYRIALLHHGLEWARVIATRGPDEGWAAQLAGELREGERPTAVVCEMDYMAVHLYDAAKALGWAIPRELSVIGMYDTPWSQVLRPQLATIAFPIDLIARLAIACLAGGRPTGERRVGVRGSLLERASLSPPP